MCTIFETTKSAFKKFFFNQPSCLYQLDQILQDVRCRLLVLWHSEVLWATCMGFSLRPRRLLRTVQPQAPSGLPWQHGLLATPEAAPFRRVAGHEAQMDLLSHRKILVRRE